MRFLHCLPLSKVRSHCRQNQKIVESLLFERFSFAGKLEMLCVNPSWVGCRASNTKS
jgi:hypothetical protein